MPSQVADLDQGPTRRQLAGRRLYLCTADRPDLGDFLAACIRGGVDVVQLRDKVLEDRPLLRRAEVAREVCHERGVPFILNDRPDLAVACGADGVHVGQDDPPPEVARRIVGPEAIIGRSTHCSDDLERAGDEPVDYLSAGPVNPTPTKPGRPGTGLGYLTEASKRATVPWFVTGGVSPETVPAMVRAGATRFVVVRYLTEAADPEANARAVASSIDRSLDAATNLGHC